jgi:hypothetical protein
MAQQFTVRRADERIRTKVTAILVGGSDRIGMETGFTENVSLRGARIITAKRWHRDETVLLSLPGFHFASGARVAYCDSLRDGSFGTGLEFTGPIEDLKIAALATMIEFPRK